MNRIILSIVLAGFLNIASLAQTRDSKQKTDSLKTPVKQPAGITNAATISRKGMFSIYKTDDKYYF